MSIGMRFDAREDPELMRHWRKIDRYEQLETWAGTLPTLVGKPLAWFFAYRKESHRRAYDIVADEY